MQPAVSTLLLECIIHVPEAGQTVHGARKVLDGDQRFQEGSVHFYITLLGVTQKYSYMLHSVTCRI